MERARSKGENGGRLGSDERYDGPASLAGMYHLPSYLHIRNSDEHVFPRDYARTSSRMSLTPLHAELL
jgi:hypothetical protein